MLKAKPVLTLIGVFLLGYFIALVSVQDKIAHFPKFQFQRPGEVWISNIPHQLDQPGFYSPLGVLNNESENAIFIMDIKDEKGTSAHFGQVTFAGNQGGYYAPSSLRLNLPDAVTTMLVPSGGSASFLFDEKPVGNLLVRYVVLGDPLAVPKTLKVQLD